MNIIEENKVLVSISKIENLQTMCLLSMGLETGGAIALALLNYGTVFFLLGTFLIILGFMTHGWLVQRVLSNWRKLKNRRTVSY